MADVFGRNATLNASLIIILVGSAMCTGAPTNAFPLLLLGRALQGVAAAGLEVLVQTILADKVSLQENAKNWSLFALVSGISYALGPVIGGLSSGSRPVLTLVISNLVASQDTSPTRIGDGASESTSRSESSASSLYSSPCEKNFSDPNPSWESTTL